MCNLERGDFFQVTFFCGSSPICQFGGNFDVIQRAKVCIILQIRSTVSHFKLLFTLLCISWQLNTARDYIQIKAKSSNSRGQKTFFEKNANYIICNLIKL